VAAAEATAGSTSVEAQRVSHVLLRRGDLHFSSTVCGATRSQLAISMHLKRVWAHRVYAMALSVLWVSGSKQ
jgi:hypothetical protein